MRPDDPARHSPPPSDARVHGFAHHPPASHAHAARVFELRYSFPARSRAPAVRHLLDGDRAKIRKLIREEAPATPLSDSRIAELLSARASGRAPTVAKYRESIGPGALQRAAAAAPAMNPTAPQPTFHDKE